MPMNGKTTIQFSPQSKSSGIILSESLKEPYRSCAEGFKLFVRVSDNEATSQNCYSGIHDDVILTHMYRRSTNGINEYLLVQEYNGYDPTDRSNLHNPLLSWKAGEIPG